VNDNRSQTHERVPPSCNIPDPKFNPYRGSVIYRLLIDPSRVSGSRRDYPMASVRATRTQHLLLNAFHSHTAAAMVPTIPRSSSARNARSLVGLNLRRMDHRRGFDCLITDFKFHNPPHSFVGEITSGVCGGFALCVTATNGVMVSRFHDRQTLRQQVFTGLASPGQPHLQASLRHVWGALTTRKAYSHQKVARPNYGGQLSRISFSLMLGGGHSP